MSESNIIFSTNSFDTSVNIHNMSPIKKKQLPLHPPSFVLRPPVVNGDRSTRQRIKMVIFHSYVAVYQRVSIAYLCISIFRSGKNGRKTQVIQVIGQECFSAQSDCVSPWTWT